MHPDEMARQKAQGLRDHYVAGLLGGTNSDGETGLARNWSGIQGATLPGSGVGDVPSMGYRTANSH